jgi:glutamine amidotransferase
MKIAVVDYGMGNLRSVSKALEHVAPDAEVCVTSDPEWILAADRVVFPGQGAMPDCMRELDGRGLREAVLKSARRRPFLGICIGLQMLFDRSEEGNAEGLRVFKGAVRRFRPETMAKDHLKVPHMGWNQVMQSHLHPLWHGISEGERFYFVHSYFAVPDDSRLIAAHATYGAEFCVAVARENIFAVQFHPEKSQSSGLRLLSNFVSWNP